MIWLGQQLGLADDPVLDSVAVVTCDWWVVRDDEVGDFSVSVGAWLSQC